MSWGPGDGETDAGTTTFAAAVLHAMRGTDPRRTAECRGAIAAMVAGFPSDGTVAPRLGLARGGVRCELPAWDRDEVLADGAVLARPEGHDVVRFADAIVVLWKDERSFDLSAAMVRRMRADEPTPTIGALATAAGDAWLAADDGRLVGNPGLGGTRDEDLATLTGRLSDVVAAEGRRPFRWIVATCGTMPGEPTRLEFEREGRVARDAAGRAASHAASLMPHRAERWVRGDGSRHLESGWRREPTIARVRPRGGRAAAFDLAAARTAARRVVGWLRETGADPALVAGAADAWGVA